jgi:hypothetical protein
MGFAAPLDMVNTVMKSILPNFFRIEKFLYRSKFEFELCNYASKFHRSVKSTTMATSSSSCEFRMSSNANDSSIDGIFSKLRYPSRSDPANRDCQNATPPISAGRRSTTPLDRCINRRRL